MCAFVSWLKKKNNNLHPFIKESIWGVCVRKFSNQVDKYLAAQFLDYVVNPMFSL